MFDYKFSCEHCGTEVVVARVCGSCGQEHSMEWKKVSTESSNCQFWCTVVVFPYGMYLVNKTDIWHGGPEALMLILGKVVLACIGAMIGYHFLTRDKSKA